MTKKKLGNWKYDFGYKVLACCANCAHVFIRYEYESGPDYYCTFEAPTRPICMSAAMNEHPLEYNEMTEKAYDKWEKWAERQSVLPWGDCWNYKTNKEVITDE